MGERKIYHKGRGRELSGPLDKNRSSMSHQLLNAKMCILGDQSVGKSSIAVRWVRDTFSDNTESTIGAAFLTRQVDLPDVSVKLQIWDTAGQERYRSLTPMYYRNASCALIAYDITSRNSFDRAIEWIKELKTDPTPKVICLAANKADLKEMSVVAESEAQAVASQHGIRLFYTSAKTGAGIDDLFNYIVQELPKLEREQDGGDVIRPDDTPTAGGDSKCPC